MSLSVFWGGRKAPEVEVYFITAPRSLKETLPLSVVFMSGSTVSLEPPVCLQKKVSHN